MTGLVSPLPINVDASVLDDLRARLALSRFPDQVPGTSWRYGFDVGYLRELCDYWHDEFAWQVVEEQLNRFSHWSTTIEGERLHFIHQRSARPDAIPLLMLHGWPGTVLEFHKVIDPLVKGAPGSVPFHLVAPSLPGFAWSGPTRSAGWDVRRMSRAFVALMSRLGYDRFAIQGTDWGSMIATELALSDPETVVGLHLNMVLVREPEEGEDQLTEAERSRLRVQQAWLAEEMGYDVIQSTRPQTLGYSLEDSPAGLAAWIVEKYRNWSDCGGDVECRFTREELLGTVTTYWVTNTVTSSMRLYYDYSHMEPRYGYDRRRVEVPTACAMFPAEMYHPPRTWVEARYDLQRWTEMPSGGHFPALEEPDLLVTDLREFFAQIR